jgi:uncharacterized membrane protein
VTLQRTSDIVETTRVEFLSMPPVWVIVLVIVPALFVFCRWVYSRERERGAWWWLPAALRGLTLALIVLFLCHPVRSTQRVRVERPVAAVLIDDSASMRERDMGELAREVGLLSDADRTAVTRAVLEQPLADLEEDYEVLLYAFGSSLRAIGSMDDLVAADGETRIGDALAALAAETRGRVLSQVVLVTDGRVNAGRDVPAALTSLTGRGVPVNTVGVGDPEIPRDVRISNITSPEVALAGDTVTLEVSVAARGFPGRMSSITVTDAESGIDLSQESFHLSDAEGATEQLVRVSFVPAKEGDLDLRVAVTVFPDERDPSNNVERRLLRVEPGRIKVLYIDGYPRYEYRFLKDSLLRVSNMDVQCFLVSAGPDFIQESSEGVGSLERIPNTLQFLLDNYHVIILGDVHPQDLGDDLGESDTILQNFRDFVEAGGGFLMQAGTRYAPQEYVGTPIEDILPVLVGDAAAEKQAIHDPGAPFRPVLARPRDPHEIVSLLPDIDENLALWQGPDGLAPLTWYYPVAKARSTAEVLLSHPRSRNAHGPHVLLATMYSPQGRTAFLATDETWRWRFLHLETYREPFWRGLIRYLALNRLRRSDYRFDLATDRASYALGERIVITARVRDEGFEPLEAESFEVSLVMPDGTRDTLELPREVDGVFKGSIPAADKGPHRLWLVDAEDPSAEAKSPRIVTVTVPSTETDDPVLDDQILERVAARTGGRFRLLSEAPGLLASLDDPKQERPLDEPEREEVWAGFPQLALLVGLLAIEWIIRKRRNLV